MNKFNFNLKTSRNLNNKLVRKVCEEEQIASIEKSSAYDPKLEAATTAIRTYCKIADDKKKIVLKDLLKIADVLKVKIGVIENNLLPKGVRALLVSYCNNSEVKCQILISKALSLKEALFNIGHELGHLLTENTPIFINDALSSFDLYREYIKNEYEAKYIAGALLINQFELKKYLNNNSSYDINKLAEDYNVSYETIMHRFVELTDLNVHMIKVASNGKIIKRFCRTDKNINWSNIISVCGLWAARYVIKKNIDNIISQFSIIVDDQYRDIGRYFCFAKLIRKLDGSNYSITLGCPAKEANKFTCYLRNAPEIRVSKLSHPCKLKLCHNDKIIKIIKNRLSTAKNI
jgi:Zn-dependent peptidase ImmA (M78 family)